MSNDTLLTRLSLELINVTAVRPSDIDDLILFRKAYPSNWSARIVRGECCGTRLALMYEWAAALQFPSYFGVNWDAFEECVNDLSWIDGSLHLTVVTGVD